MKKCVFQFLSMQMKQVNWIVSKFVSRTIWLGKVSRRPFCSRREESATTRVKNSRWSWWTYVPRRWPLRKISTIVKTGRESAEEWCGYNVVSKECRGNKSQQMALVEVTANEKIRNERMRITSSLMTQSKGMRINVMFHDSMWVMDIVTTKKVRERVRIFFDGKEGFSLGTMKQRHRLASPPINVSLILVD